MNAYGISKANCGTCARSSWLLAASALLFVASAAAADLKALLDEDLEAILRRFPFGATYRGVPGYNHLVPDLSFATLERERARERSMLQRLRAMDPSSLEGQDRLSYELLLDKMEVAVEAQSFPDSEGLILRTSGGLHDAMPRAGQLTTFRTEADYRDYLQRLRGTGQWADDTIARLEAGLRSGWISPVDVIDRVVAAIDSQLAENVDDALVLAPFRKFPSLAAEGKQAVTDVYLPALRRYRAFLREKYRPRAPADAGLGALPGGAKYYDFLIRTRVIRGESAASIHAIGLREVARVRAQMGLIAEELGYHGTTDHFIRYLMSDPSFFFSSPEAVLAAYRAMPPRVDPQLPKLFHHVPRMRYEVRAMTPSESASSTAANYQVGSLRLGTPGYFTINARGYANEAVWRVETLFLHEVVPGHHMQGARAAEVEGLHPWRSMGTFNVGYSEGWALYAERLGYQMGLFKDPYQRYGQLQAELFRAARLVADTGIHAYGWTRDRAILYMWIAGGMDYQYAHSEVDRYFSNPAQALGYMMGQRKFLELRARAEKALGPRFDIRDFHAVAIDHGPMPLSVLEKRVDAWIQSSR